MEVDLAGAERGGERLDVEPADHQDAPVRDVLDDADDEAGRVPADGGGIEAGGEVHRVPGAWRRSCGCLLVEGSDREPGGGHRRP